MSIVYLVYEFGGQWEDSWESPVCVVKTRERAQELVEQFQRESDERDERLTRFVEDDTGFPEHLNPDEEGYCIDEPGCEACEIEAYWPDMEYALYSYTEIGMED